MPDGRPISWPAGFSEELAAAVEALRLPALDPAPLVQVAEYLSFVSAQWDQALSRFKQFVER